LISRKYSDAKASWSRNPGLRGKDSVGIPPPPKKSCLDKARNSLARTVAQIRSGHWRSAVYLKRIKKRTTDHCWFCHKKERKMTRSHVLLHCTRREPGGCKTPSVGKRSIRVLLANPRWESRLLHFLELSGVGRRVEDGSDEDESRAARMDGWVVWEDRVRDREPD
jgi:hypothetical protein